MDAELLKKEKEELELQINNLIKDFANKTGLELNDSIVIVDHMDKFKGIKLKFTI